MVTMSVVFPFRTRPSVALLLATATAIMLYLITLAVYRLYFSPTAKFPGPKLAALSRWYEIYFDCILPGQFEFHIHRSA